MYDAILWREVSSQHIAPMQCYAPQSFGKINNTQGGDYQQLDDRVN
jgi:hypothetical protein